MATFRQVQVPSNLGELTNRSLDINSSMNDDVFNIYGIDPNSEPTITNIEILNDNLTELLIRFDNSPKYYQKEDYAHLISLLYNSLKYIYKPESNKTVEFKGLATIATNPINEISLKFPGIYLVSETGIYSEFLDEDGHAIEITEDLLIQSIIFLVPHIVDDVFAYYTIQRYRLSLLTDQSLTGDGTSTNKYRVVISSEENNILQRKTDGLFVTVIHDQTLSGNASNANPLTVRLSNEGSNKTKNILSKRSDGLHAEETDPYYIADKPNIALIDGSNSAINVLSFITNPTVQPLLAGQIQYNPDEKTLDFGLSDGGTGSLFKEMFDYYVNIDTVPLVDGMIVSTAAIPGNRKGIKRTDFTNLTSIRSIVGMVTVPYIGQNQSGRVTTKGIINNLNTSGIAEGAQLWGNPAVLGGWTGNKPAKGNYAVQIGQVVVSHSTVGSVELNVSKDIKFGDLADVDGDTTTLNNTDKLPIKDGDGIVRFIPVANVKAALKADTDLLYEPLLGFTPENAANKGQANGYASLDGDGLVPAAQLPSFVDDLVDAYGTYTDNSDPETIIELWTDETHTVSIEKYTGKIYVDVVTRFQFRWSGSVWGPMRSGPVQSVAGKTGNVLLVKADVGLGNVDNTSDANKPVSTLQAAAIATKVGLTGNETVAGVKTFSSSPVVPDPTTAGQALNKGAADSSYVGLTGAQNIAGVKTFTDSPVVPTPVNNGDAANKEYVQSVITVGNDTYQENKLITDARVATLESVINSANLNQETTATATGVDTIPLPKTAANGGMQVQLFGQSAQNLVVNGDFRNGTTGWFFSNVTSSLLTGGILMQKTNTESLMRMHTTGTVVTGDIYYSMALIKCSISPSANDVMFGQFNASLSVNSSHISYAQSTTDLQVLSIRGAMGQPANFFFTGVGSKSTYVGTISVYGIRVINLTAIFGGGNEPSKEQCYLLFANYFEGSKNVLGTGRMRSIGKNLLDYTKGYNTANPPASGTILNVLDGNRILAYNTSSTRGRGYTVNLLPNTSYVFSARGYSSADGKTPYVAIYDNGTISMIASNINFSGDKSLLFTTGSTGRVNIHFFINGASTSFVSFENIQLERNIIATTYEPYRQSILQLTTPPLRSNGLIKDEIRKGTNGYELVKRVGVGTLGANGITGSDFEGGLIGACYDGDGSVSTWTLNTSSPISGAQDGRLIVTTAPASLGRPVYNIGVSRTQGQYRRLSFDFKVNSGSPAIASFLPGSGTININRVLVGAGRFEYYYTCNGAQAFGLYFGNSGLYDIQIDNFKDELINTPDGAATGITTTVIGSNIHYTLATPTITPIAHAGLLNSNSSGTVYFEPIIADAGVYGANIATQLTDYPIASLESIRKYANGTYTELNTATAVIAGNGLSFTHPDLVSGDLVMFTYAYNKESIRRSMTLTHYDSRFVKADTANGKVYRIVPVVTNGVVSWTAVEV